MGQGNVAQSDDSFTGGGGGGDGREKLLLDARAVEVSRYFSSSRKPPNVDVQKHAKIKGLPFVF